MTRRELLIAALVPGPAYQYVQADLAGRILESTNEVDGRRSVGSLLKPFLAAAFYRTNPKWPVVTCYGTASGCWLAHGHGRQDAVSAIANSCNAYFLVVSRSIDRAALDRVCLENGLAVPERDWTAERLIGLGEGWPQSLRSIAGAFGKFVRDGNCPLVLEGMRRCAERGTARAIGLPCFAKTGTGACHHPLRLRDKTAGDGYVAVIYPTVSPRTVLVAERHGTTGAVVAGSVRDRVRRL